MTGLPSQLRIDLAKIVPPSTLAAASPPIVDAPPSTAVAVYRPNTLEVAERMSSIATTLDTRLAPLTQRRIEVKVITDWWAVPLLAGGAGALGLALFTELAAVVPLVVASVGAALSSVGAVIHPKLRKRAADAAPPLLQGDLRDEVMRLETASRSFPASEGGRVEAPELQAFVANKAKALLTKAKAGDQTTTDTDLQRVLDRLASAQSQLTPEETHLLELIELCIKASSSRYGERGVPKAFAQLSDAHQRELAPFVRERFFDEDGLKAQYESGEHAAYLELHRCLEAIGPKTQAPFPTTPTAIPAPVASHHDVVSSLDKLADFDELFAWGDRQYRYGNHGPETAAKAVAFAIEPQHSGVERALFGLIAERHLDALRGFDFRLRSALADVVATAKAEPAAVRAEAGKIMNLVDTLAAPFRTSSYSDGIMVPGPSLRKVIAMLELAKMD